MVGWVGLAGTGCPNRGRCGGAVAVAVAAVAVVMALALALVGVGLGLGLSRVWTVVAVLIVHVTSGLAMGVLVCMLVLGWAGGSGGGSRCSGGCGGQSRKVKLQVHCGRHRCGWRDGCGRR